MPKVPLTLIAAALLAASIAFAKATGARDTPMPAGLSSVRTVNERFLALIEGHMSSEAALAAKERAAVATVRANLRQDEAQQRAAVGVIRREYRVQSGTMTTLHAPEKAALNAELM